MRLNTRVILVGALASALTAGAWSVEAAQQERRERGGRESQGQARARSGSDRAQGGNRAQATAAQPERGEAQAPQGDGAVREQRPATAEQRAAPEQRPAVRGQRPDARDSRSDVRNGRQDDGRSWDRHNDDHFRAPQRVPYRAYRSYRPAPRRYYGPGGHLSVYFGFGSGYRYGSLYSGRVYGYVPPPVYGSQRYYGDVRLLIRPRNAAVFVDGYYAGVVDDFDGVFQRLTLAVGPHQIEVDAPGFQSQAFDVYVDPTHTVDLHGDLYPDAQAELYPDGR